MWTHIQILQGKRDSGPFKDLIYRPVAPIENSQESLRFSFSSFAPGRKIYAER